MTVPAAHTPVLTPSLPPGPCQSSVTVALVSQVTEKLGVVAWVISSALESPVSEATSRSGVPRPVAAVSTVTVSALEGPAPLPAVSVCEAVTV